jgi:hypothetical protein
MLSTPLRSGALFSSSINWTQPDTHPHLDASTSRTSIIERSIHRTINRALHRAYYKLTPHRLSKCSQHRTLISTCHRISKAHLEVSHHLRIMTVASPSSLHSSNCPTISH